MQLETLAWALGHLTIPFMPLKSQASAFFATRCLSPLIVAIARRKAKAGGVGSTQCPLHFRWGGSGERVASGRLVMH